MSASKHITIWVQVECHESPASIGVSESADIYDLIKDALVEEKLHNVAVYYIVGRKRS